MVKLLFVCTGNICRSPTAHGIFRARIAAAGLQDRIAVDSAGMHGYHRGEPPDQRSQEAARKFGVDITDLRARQIALADLDRFDIIAVMERNHLRQILGLRPTPPRAETKLLLSYCGLDRDVPDPYYDDDRFDSVYRLIEQGADGLLRHVRQRLLA